MQNDVKEAKIFEAVRSVKWSSQTSIGKCRQRSH